MEQFEQRGIASEAEAGGHAHQWHQPRETAQAHLRCMVLQAGCRLVAGWMQTGCRLDASGCSPEGRPRRTKCLSTPLGAPRC